MGRNITQIIQCEQLLSERFPAPLGMTALLLNGWSVAAHQIRNRKRRIQSQKEE